MNEPAVFPVRGDNSLPWFADHHGRLHRDVHNIYAMHMARAAYEYMVKRRGGRGLSYSQGLAGQAYRNTRRSGQATPRAPGMHSG
ncbi:hypothetical protein [Thermogymnomonas acidicola]|uniref:TIM-barrel domain-containing protein n=1 Tax=Thermogymnomonas acidicola TaxID=399579 RepID=UPI0009461FA4|nr:TIM-barrel domain-containing protein [Thermogymnomonas acidicola]